MAVTIIVVIMINKTISSVGTPSISAMELRSNPGTVLDRVDYKNESLIIERAGKPKAAIIPINQYNELQRIRQESRDRLFQMIKKIQKRTSKYDPKKIQAAIDKATSQVE